MAKYEDTAMMYRQSPAWRTARAKGICESLMKPLELGDVYDEIELIKDPKRKFGVALCLALYAKNNPNFWIETEVPYYAREYYSKAKTYIDEIYQKEKL